MRVAVTPHYKDLFPGGNETLEDLLEGVPSLVVLELIALIDAELFSRDEGAPTQVKIFDLMLGRQSPQSKLLILSRIYRDKDDSGYTHQFFSRHYNLTLMHYILVNFQEGDVDDLTPAQEFNVFKAYFLAAEQFGQAPVDEREAPPFDETYFARVMWPSMADGFEINMRNNPYYAMIRGVVLLNYLQHRSDHKKYVDDFLRLHNKVTTLNYAFDVFNILNVSFRSLKNKDLKFASFTVANSAGFESLFAQFRLDRAAYREKYALKKENYAGIKANPLYRLNADTWLVLNWSFLSNKLYESLIFDFYNTSGIAGEKVFNTFIKFKKFIAEQVTEKYLFQSLAKACWNKKHTPLLFDDDKVQGFPDAYYRDGNKLFLFEIKDVFFPSGAVNSFSYERIKEVIDTKLNSPEKGTGQLIKQLNALTRQPFEQPQRYKSISKLEVYPIIVYTDILFNMPGISDYVGRTFDTMLGEAGLRDKFKKIHPLTMINMNYLVANFDLFRQRQTSLDVFIDYYHHQIANRVKKDNRLHKVEYHQAIYDVFENVTKALVTQDDAERKHIRWIYDALNLKEGLPDSIDSAL